MKSGAKSPHSKVPPLRRHEIQCNNETICNSAMTIAPKTRLTEGNEGKEGFKIFAVFVCFCRNFVEKASGSRLLVRSGRRSQGSFQNSESVSCGPLTCESVWNNPSVSTVGSSIAPVISNP
jgi:hypothetical protein